MDDKVGNLIHSILITTATGMKVIGKMISKLAKAYYAYLGKFYPSVILITLSG